MVRDAFCNVTTRFDEAYNFNEDWLSGRPDFIKGLQPDGMPSAYNRIYEVKLDQMTISYSRGDDLEKLQQAIPDLLEAYFTAEISSQGVWEEHVYAPNVIHDDINATIAFCYCLGVDNELLNRFMNYLLPEGGDTLTDRLVATKLPDRKICDPKKWALAKEYRFLNEAIDAPPAQQVKLIDKYLKRYDKKLAVYKRPLEDFDHYEGLFSYELAAVVKAFNIDDSAFIDNPYYPKDLVHYQD